MGRTRHWGYRTAPETAQSELDERVRERFGFEGESLLSAVGLFALSVSPSLLETNLRHCLSADLLDHSVHIGMVRDWDSLARLLSALSPIRALRFHVEGKLFNGIDGDTLIKVLNLILNLDIKVLMFDLAGTTSADVAQRICPLMARINGGDN